MRSQRSVLRPIKVAVALVVGTLLAGVQSFPPVHNKPRLSSARSSVGSGRRGSGQVSGPAPWPATWQRRPTDRPALRSCGRCPGWM